MLNLFFKVQIRGQEHIFDVESDFRKTKVSAKFRFYDVTMERSTLLISLIYFLKKQRFNVNLLLLILQNKMEFVREEIDLSCIWQDVCCTKRILRRCFG